MTLPIEAACRRSAESTIFLSLRTRLPRLADLFLLLFQLFLVVFAPFHCFIVFLPEMRTKSLAKKNA
jgi:hypothetical protein